MLRRDVIAAHSQLPIFFWWGLVGIVALAIKYHFSNASVEQLDWILRPVSLLLEWMGGYSFARNGLNEWASESANIRLAKGCSGINFMLMSLLAWAWSLSPGPQLRGAVRYWLANRVALILVIVCAAWSTSILANSLRILVAIEWHHASDLQHKLLGMGIYLPILSLQLCFGSRGGLGAAILGPALVYILMMVMVPLLTGNAFQNLPLFLSHTLLISVMASILGCGYLCLRIKISKPFPVVIDEPHLAVNPAKTP